MNGSQHLLLGVVATASGVWAFHSLTGLELEPAPVGAALLSAGIGALMPDIDHPYSTISFGLPKKIIGQAIGIFFPVLVIAALLAMGGKQSFAQILWGWYEIPMVKTLLIFIGLFVLIALSLMVASFLISTLFGHRGATHSLVFMGGATALAVVVSLISGISWWYGLFFGWGWLTHLAADATTDMGLPALLWPFDS